MITSTNYGHLVVGLINFNIFYFYTYVIKSTWDQ